MNPSKKKVLSEEESDDASTKIYFEYRKQCMENNFEFIDKMVDDELKEIRSYRLFEEQYDYENPFVCDDSISIKDDVKKANEN